MLRHATGMPFIDAHEDFTRARRAQIAARAARRERIALAHRRGVSLPPITVLQRPDGYYVVDGRHRVSVARALGHRDIEAWVTCVRDHGRAAA